jgi:hypothetical protein
MPRDYLSVDQCRGCGTPINRPRGYDPKDAFYCGGCKFRVDCLTFEHTETPCYVMCDRCFIHYAAHDHEKTGAQFK